MPKPFARGLLAAPMLAAIVLAVPPPDLAVSAEAATAHNSQAGADGPNTHICAATPYFAAGGCASAALVDDRLYPFDVPPAPARPGRRPTRPGLPADAADE